MTGAQLTFNWARCSEVAIKVLAKWSDLDDKRNYNLSTANSIKRCYISIWKECVSCTEDWLQCHEKVHLSRIICALYAGICFYTLETIKLEITRMTQWDLKAFSEFVTMLKTEKLLNSLATFYYSTQSMCHIMDALHCLGIANRFWGWNKGS